MEGAGGRGGGQTRCVEADGIDPSKIGGQTRFMFCRGERLVFGEGYSGVTLQGAEAWTKTEDSWHACIADLDWGNMREWG